MIYNQVGITNIKIDLSINAIKFSCLCIRVLCVYVRARARVRA